LKQLNMGAVAGPSSWDRTSTRPHSSRSRSPGPYKRCDLHGLSFANNQAAWKSLGCNTFIAMVKSAELGNCDYAPDALHLSWNRGLLVESQMRAGLMIIIEVPPQCAFEMLGVEDDEMVQTLAPNGADESLCVGILPRAVGRREDLFYAVWSKYSRERSEFMMDVPHARRQMGSAVGVRHGAGQSETPAPE